MKIRGGYPDPRSQQNMAIIEDKKTGEIGICFLEGASEYLEEKFSKSPSKTNYGEDISKLMGGAAQDIAQQDLDKMTPINERQMKSIFPHSTAMQMRDPLTTIDKTRIHDNIRRDGATKRALLFLTYFMMPEPPLLTIALNRKYATKQREIEQLTLIQDNPEYLDILEEMMNRDDDLDLYTREIELVFAAHGYGRAVQVKQYDNQHYPKRLIPLPSTRLGNVWIDKYSHEFLGVEYKDYPTDKRILLANDIIHMEVDDYGVTPNARYYGMAAAETCMSIGERNRAANEIAIPEIMKRMFAPLMLVQSKSTTQAKLQQIRDAWKSGKTVFYNKDLTITVVPIPHDLEKIRDTVIEGDKQIFRALTVPLGVGWQDDQNRATFEGSIIQWYSSVLGFKRSQLDNIMWRQWYKPQLEMTYENRMAAKLAVNGGMMDYLLEKAKGIAQGIPFRVKLEYKNVKTTGFLDTAAALAQFGDRKYLLPDMIRDEAGLGKYNEEMNEADLAIKEASVMPTFTAADKTMNGPPSPGGPTLGGPNLSSQSSGAFGKGLPSATSPDRDYDE